MSSSAGRRAVFAAMLLATVLFRAVPPWHYVFAHPGDIRLFEVDPWFHLRQAKAMAEHFPTVHRWDLGTDYPTGERGMNQGLFEWSLALLGLMVGAGHPSLHLLMLLAAWIPVLLAMVALWLVYRVALEFTDPPAALAACFLFLCMPGTLSNYSMLGFFDNHIAEVALALWTCLVLVRGWTAALAKPRPWWRPAWREALPVSIFLLTWPGSPVYVLLTGLSLGCVGLLAAEVSAVRATATFSTRWALGVASLWYFSILLWPDLLQWPPALRWVTIGLLSIGLGLPAALHCWAAARLQARPIGWVGIALLLGALAAAAASPSGRWAIGLLLEPRSSLVSEQRAVTFAIWFGTLGLELPLALLSGAFLVWVLWQRRLPASAAIPLTFALAWLGLWLQTHDFIYLPPPFLALLVVLGTACWRRRHVWTVVSIIAVVQMVLVPLGITMAPWPGSGAMRRGMAMDDAWETAMEWMRKCTPPLPPPAMLRWPHGGIPYGPGSYGVFTNWDYGEYVSVLGERPPTWSESIESPLAGWGFIEDEEDAVAALVKLLHRSKQQRIRYAVLNGAMVGDFFITAALVAGKNPADYVTTGRAVQLGDRNALLRVRSPRWQSTMLARLYEQDASAMHHFRLVYETPQRVMLAHIMLPAAGSSDLQVLRAALPLSGPDDPLSGLDNKPDVQPFGGGYLYDGHVQAEIKIFEQVPGAHLRGTASPNAEIQATLELRSKSSGRTLRYQQTVHAGVDGSYEMVVPYPTTPEPTMDVTASGPYRLTVPQQPPLLVPVTEAQIQSAAQVLVSPQPD